MKLEKLTELLRDETVDAPPPETRRWQYFLDQGAKLQCEFVRRRDGLGFGPATVIVSVVDPAEPLAPDPPIPWNHQIHRWLVDKQVKAGDPANEAERFGFALHEELEPIERECGSGYFNAVLVNYLHKSGLDDDPVLKEKLAKVHTYPPGGESAIGYQDRIKRVIGACARSLVKVGYADPGQTIQILSNALAYYVDERFNISTRAMLGFG
ncbi:MAG TPA: hypothetical protein VEL05_05005 [Candidatus Acidoferrum sp.]|nr:hypothetical protein [Candidatus Acidoferrum sp.]